eukprot:CAMPEP_0180406306 /NCGR_PEP_ID=MMETSP0989-20121125/41100_1 /TAXON_ID=697907 /ORGANISM="non described non described, Strain CCMP2293" /LENGTH=70 /DNA_ID=CAMNT_0022410023 /DNA_START=505 /DNA_END=714 /DNA_ORIENTATION=+
MFCVLRTSAPHEQHEQAPAPYSRVPRLTVPHNSLTGANPPSLCMMFGLAPATLSALESWREAGGLGTCNR